MSTATPASPMSSATARRGVGRWVRRIRISEMAMNAGMVAIMTAGAYGAVMSSAYNARPPAAEVLVKGDAWSVVRPRMSDDAIVEMDRLPDWLGS